jgi:hypothetical protein
MRLRLDGMVSTILANFNPPDKPDFTRPTTVDIAFG